MDKRITDTVKVLAQALDHGFRELAGHLAADQERANKGISAAVAKAAGEQNTALEGQLAAIRQDFREFMATATAEAVERMTTMVAQKLETEARVRDSTCRALDERIDTLSRDTGARLNRVDKKLGGSTADDRA